MTLSNVMLPSFTLHCLSAKNNDNTLLFERMVTRLHINPTMKLSPESNQGFICD